MLSLYNEFKCYFDFFVTQSLTNLDREAIFLDLMYIVCELVWPFIFCHFATMAVTRITSNGDIVYASNWYEYPLEFRKNIISIIARSQEPIQFTGFKLIGGSLEVFGIVSVSNKYCNH